MLGRGVPQHTVKRRSYVCQSFWEIIAEKNKTTREKTIYSLWEIESKRRNFVKRIGNQKLVPKVQVWRPRCVCQQKTWSTFTRLRTGKTGFRWSKSNKKKLRQYFSGTSYKPENKAHARNFLFVQNPKKVTKIQFKVETCISFQLLTI